MTFLVIGAVSGCVAVVLGAFGAHALKDMLTGDMLATFETAVRYQMHHSLALLATGWAIDRFGDRSFHLAGWAFVCGIALFSGSLYGMTLTGARWLGAITPFGGAAFLTGWLLLVRGFWKSRLRVQE